ncbi:hypothetical protein [Polynucleobacter sp. AP-Nino-20-G2]|uniref:hypothetical protein n=1 Tax=Polynucleobacter sp. AP-Nino-20-G2 TaxID=2576917 RepID=UPI001BFE321F|nr:hypothetical protein [Polynucleobacter sp. AP-Nino-20-G2]QWE17241.1 hypothetical protein FD960_03210 [Polynucleobacter sp. AP-Nino-20-G2]
MAEKEIDPYTQSLLGRIVSMTQEIDNLRAAYMIVNERLNNLTALTEYNVKEILEEAARVEDFAKLAVDASKLTEESAIVTKNNLLIDAAKKSTLAACTVHHLAIELRATKLANIKKGLSP